MAWMWWPKRPRKEPPVCALCKVPAFDGLTLSRGQHRGKTVCEGCINKNITPFITVIEEYGPQEQPSEVITEAA
jgi:hypothetical protein